MVSACLTRKLRNGAGVKWSFKIATVAGIEVRIHTTFVLLLGLYAWMFYLDAGIQAARDGLVFMLLLFLCVLLHEFGHAFAARVFGIRTPDITLLPIGGLARLERLPSSPWQEFVIAVAGPAVNVAIVLGLIGILGGLPPLPELLRAGQSGGDLLAGLLVVNGFLIAFNMLPAFPMDGGRVLRALLAVKLRHSLATLIAARVGQGIAVFFVLSSLFPPHNYILMLIGAFVFLGAQQELAYARMREAAQRYRVGEVMETQYATLPDSLALGEAPHLLIGSDQEVFPVVNDALEFRSLVTREALLAALQTQPAETPLGALGRCVPLLHAETRLEDALETMQKSRELLLPVVNSGGQLVGLIDGEQVAELARNRKNLPKM